MKVLNPSNERLKRDYLRFLKEARGKSEATLDSVRKAIRSLHGRKGLQDLPVRTGDRVQGAARGD
jgi:hypothetical protein